MTDDISSAVASWIGPLIGIGFGVATIKMLGNLNVSESQGTEIGNILSRAKRVSDGFLLRCYDKNVSRAKRVLKLSNFKIIGEYPSTPGLTYIKFVEK